ncbi:Ribosomal protein L9/RNase H1, N-terminal [Sesbania bispinosa]|nr:Ribosomal protein L9/RNase H1, N-terminal [Sesbania bispinosa]
MARKTYVVFVGRIPSVYESWVECQEQVNGFRGCSYSSFPTREKAERAWEEWANRGGGAPRQVVLALPAHNTVLGAHDFNVVHHPGENALIDHKGMNPGPVMVGSGLNVREEPNGPEDVAHETCLTLLCCVAVTLLSIYYYFFG